MFALGLAIGAGLALVFAPLANSLIKPEVDAEGATAEVGLKRAHRRLSDGSVLGRDPLRGRYRAARGGQSDPEAFAGDFERRRQELRSRHESGRIGWALLWLLGVPIPVLLVLYLLRGCT